MKPKVSKSSISTIKRNKRMAYIEVLLVVFIFGLFICSHFLTVIDNSIDPENPIIWWGIDATNFISDFVLYSAIFLTIILFILILHRNFIVRGKK